MAWKPKPHPKREFSASATIEAQEWNRRHPVGTHVRFWRMLRQGPGEEGVTRAPAAAVSGSPVVWIEGLQGCVFLHNVDVIYGHVEAVHPEVTR